MVVVLLMRESFNLLSPYCPSKREKRGEREKEKEELITVMPDGSELSERLMKVYPTLPSKMQLLDWQLLLVLQLVTSPRVKRVSWFQVWYVPPFSTSLSSVPSPALSPFRQDRSSCSARRPRPFHPRLSLRSRLG